MADSAPVEIEIVALDAAGRDAYVRRAVQPSPARAEAPEPQAWLPLSELAALPALEELLKPENLVESGQTLAIRMRARDPQPFEEPPFVERSRVIPRPLAEPAPRPTRAAVVAERRAVRKKRRVRILLVAALLVLTLVLVPVLFLRSERTIQLVVDGEERTITARGDTVADAVRAAGVWLGPHDRVSPAMGSPLPGGTPIRVHRARPVVVDVDGAVRTEWVIAGTTDELRDELRIEGPSEALAEGEIDFAAPVVFRTRHAATVIADGAETPMSSTALTVGELLTEAGVVVNANDEVVPAVTERVTDGARITVARISGEERTEERSIPRATERRNDSTLASGQTKVLQPGVDGVERVTILTEIRDGQPVGDRIIHREVIRDAQPKIIAVGTKAASVTRESTSAPAAAPASSGNSETGQATWYAHIPGTCAHKTIPKGTVVTVTNTANGKSTTCVVADRGPFAAGRIIDLTPDVFDKIGARSTGVIPVRIEW